MIRWTPFPLVRITIVLCFGILLGIYNPEILQLEWGVITLLIVFSFAVFFYLLRRKYFVAKFLFWIGCFVALSISGIVLVNVKTEINTENHLIHVRDTIIAYEAIIDDHFEEKLNSHKTTVSVVRIRTSIGWLEVSGKVNFYFSKEGFTNNLIWGDHIIIKGAPQETNPPGNPHEFNYKRFLTYNNIYHQHYVRQGEWIRTGRFDPSLLRYSAMARNYFTGIIKKYVPGKHEQAVSLALIIGVKDGIDSEIISAYSASGAMHVLAVSGLHVGIIYWMLLIVLKPIQKTKRGKWIVSSVCFVILWNYAFVTGLSPSVLRAVMMFSFVAVARAVNQRSSIYNTLAGSAFILLIFNPYLIMSVGFQLSYLAVIGIIWVQRPLYLLYEPTNRVVDWVWKISCVSIAAQATTFSLGLLYFHQFPAYFLFSNLIVIPVSTLVLTLGILLLGLSFISPVAFIVGWLLEKSSWILNWSVFMVEDLPYSIVSNIYLTVAQSWIILGILVSLIFVFQYKRMGWLYVSIFLSVLFSMDRWYHFLDRQKSPQIIVYNVSGASAVDVIEMGQSIFLGDSALLTDANRIRFHISGNRLYNLVKKIDPRIVKKSDSLQMFHFNKKALLFVNRSVTTFYQSIKPDIVIVSKGGIWSVPNLENQFPETTIVLDGTCNLYFVSKIKSKVKNAERIYSVAESGAFVRML